MVAQISEPPEQALDRFAGVEPAEVVGAEVRIADTIGKHVPHRGEHGSGDREDGFLGATSCLDAQELGVQVGAFHSDGGPCSSDKRGFQPCAAFAHAGAAAFAGALIVTRTEARPGDQVGGIGEARHVGADLGQDDLGGHVTHAGDGDQQADALPDRRQRFSQGGVQFSERVLQGLDDARVKLEQSPVVIGNAAAQCLAQFRRFPARIALGQRGQPLGIVLAGNDGIEHGTSTAAQHV